MEFLRFNKFVEEVRLIWVMILLIVALMPVDKLLDRDFRDITKRWRIDAVDRILIKEIVKNGDLSDDAEVIYRLFRGR
jgi:hypothetical protein